MPKNCSADVEAVIAYVDSIFDTGDAAQIKKMKAIFGLEDIVHNDDFGQASTYDRSPLEAHQIADGPLLSSLVKLVFNYWQDGTIEEPAIGFYQFCDALEVDANGKMAPSKGWGLEHALKAWGNFWKEDFYPRSMFHERLSTVSMLIISTQQSAAISMPSEH